MAVEPTKEQPARGIGKSKWLWLALLSLALFMALLPISSYVAALSSIQLEIGLSNTAAGALFSAYLAGYAASALFVVPLTDQFGTKRVVYASAALSVAAHLLFPLTAHDAVTGSVLRALAGVGFLGVYIPGLRIVAERFSKDKRGSAIGLFVTAQYASHSGSLALTGWVMSVMEWRGAYTVVAAASAASIPMMAMLLRSHSPAQPLGSSGRLDPTILASRPVQFVILGYSIHALNLYAIRVWLPAFLASILIARGVADGQAAVTAASAGGLALAFGAAGPVVGGVISDRLGRTMAASSILGISAVCAVGLAWVVHWPWGLIVGASAVLAWAASADSAIYQTGITEVSDPTRLGSALALQASLGLVGGVIGPIMFGGILDIMTCKYQWAFAFSALGSLAVVAIIGLQRIRSMQDARMYEGDR